MINNDRNNFTFHIYIGIETISRQINEIPRGSSFVIPFIFSNETKRNLERDLPESRR